MNHGKKHLPHSTWLTPWTSGLQYENLPLCRELLDLLLCFTCEYLIITIYLHGASNHPYEPLNHGVPYTWWFDSQANGTTIGLDAQRKGTNTYKMIKKKSLSLCVQSIGGSHSADCEITWHGWHSRALMIHGLQWLIRGLSRPHKEEASFSKIRPSLVGSFSHL